MTTWLLLVYVCGGFAHGPDPCQWKIIGAAISEETCLELAFKISRVELPVECVKVTRPG